MIDSTTQGRTALGVHNTVAPTMFNNFFKTFQRGYERRSPMNIFIYIIVNNTFINIFYLSPQMWA